MSLDVVVVMDGPETVVPATDTSFGLVVAAGERGHRCWHCGPGDLSVVDGTVRANVRPIRPDVSGADPLGLGDEIEIDLGDVDVVLVRPDPPFDQRYLHLTLMLDLVEERTLIVNSPRGLRAANEKLYALRFPDVTPPTIVTVRAPTASASGRSVPAIWEASSRVGARTRPRGLPGSRRPGLDDRRATMGTAKAMVVDGLKGFG